MANGSAEDGYVFVAGGDACERCVALDGLTSSLPMSLPHPNCRCHVARTDRTGCYVSANIEYFGTQRYGPNGRGAIVNVEISVECEDGSTIGASTAVDIGFGDWDIASVFMALWSELGDTFEGLGEGCECSDEFLCC